MLYLSIINLGMLQSDLLNWFKLYRRAENRHGSTLAIVHYSGKHQQSAASNQHIQYMFPLHRDASSDNATNLIRATVWRELEMSDKTAAYGVSYPR